MDSPNVGPSPSSQARPTDVRAINSQTAINPPLSNTTSRHLTANQSFGPGASASNISTPRTSTTGGLRQQQDASLSEHINLPLVAPKPWVSTQRTWSRAELQRERSEFFETRVTGRPEIWAAIKEVSELVRQGDLTDAQGIIDAAGITLPTGRLEEGIYDERGVHYRVSENILTDPMNVVDEDGTTVVGSDSLSKELDTGKEATLAIPPTDGATQEKIDKGKEALEKDAVKVKCRLSDRGGPDTIVLLGQTQAVSVLIRRLRTETSISSSARVRLAYLGRILVETQSLEEQGWQPGHVVQVLVSNHSP